MYCKAGPVKIRWAARGVPDRDPGPLSHEPKALPLTGSFPRSQVIFAGKAGSYTWYSIPGVACSWFSGFEKAAVRIA